MQRGRLRRVTLCMLVVVTPSTQITRWRGRFRRCAPRGERLTYPTPGRAVKELAVADGGVFAALEGAKTTRRHCIGGLIRQGALGICGDGPR